MARDRFILNLKGVVIGNMFIGDNQHVNGGAWVDIIKSGDYFVLIDESAWYFSSDNLTKKAVGISHGFSSQLGTGNGLKFGLEQGHPAGDERYCT